MNLIQKARNVLFVLVAGLENLLKNLIIICGGKHNVE